MGQLAHFDQEKLYHMFGIDAELLIDHAWGRETATISDIKAYTPKSRSLTSGQVLMKDYSFENGKLIVKEMVDMINVARAYETNQKVIQTYDSTLETAVTQIGRL